MAKNYKQISYFEERTDVVRIFDDLEKLHDFCRFEMLPFNEADLYNRYSKVWQSYEWSKKPKKPWNGDRKPRGEFNRGEFNRGGNNNGNNFRQRNDSFSR